MKKNVETMLACFSQLRRVYAASLNQKFAEENFSPSEISILFLLSNNPTITTGGQLTTVLGVSKGLVSRSLDSLLRRGLIAFEEDPRDRRVRHIALTEEAEPITARVRESVEEVNRRLLADISEEEVRQMEATMTKILRRFEEAEVE